MVYNHLMPDQSYFRTLYRKFRINETVFTKRVPKKTFIVNEKTKINVLAFFEAFQEKSRRDYMRALESVSELLEIF